MTILRRLALAAACIFASVLPVSAATTQPFQQEIGRESAHLAKVLNRLKRHPQLATNPYIRLDLAVARRFIDRNQHPAPRRKQAPQWTKEQMDEVGEVL